MDNSQHSQHSQRVASKKGVPSFTHQEVQAIRSLYDDHKMSLKTIHEVLTLRLAVSYNSVVAAATQETYNKIKIVHFSYLDAMDILLGREI